MTFVLLGGTTEHKTAKRSVSFIIACDEGCLLLELFATLYCHHRRAELLSPIIFCFRFKLALAVST